MLIIKDKNIIKRSSFINFGVILFFISMNVYELSEGIIQNTFRQATLIVLFAISISCCWKRINIKLILLIVICLISGYLNYKYIGNSRLSNQIVIVIYIISSLLLTSDLLDIRIIRFAIYMNVTVVVLRFMTVGLYNRIYNVASNNYISVYLLLPAIVYYSLLEKRNCKIEIWSALLVWFVSLLAMGRGGIICSTFFLLGLFYYRFKRYKFNKKLLLIFVIAVIVVMVIPFIGDVLNDIKGIQALDRFSKKGFTPGDRDKIWGDYLKHGIKTKENLLLGGENTNTLAAIQFDGNTHNTFINIHVYNGIIPVVLIIIISIFNIIKAIRLQRWIYCLCVTVIYLRAFTDVIFWLNLGTPVLFFILLFEFENKLVQEFALSKLSNECLEKI